MFIVLMCCAGKDIELLEAFIQVFCFLSSKKILKQLHIVVHTFSPNNQAGGFCEFKAV